MLVLLFTLVPCDITDYEMRAENYDHRSGFNRTSRKVFAYYTDESVKVVTESKIMTVNGLASAAGVSAIFALLMCALIAANLAAWVMTARKPALS